MDNGSQRCIRKRIVIEGTLKLITLTHLGNGESDDSMDMKLRRDSADGETPVLPGTTLTGALRSYLRTLERGYGKKAEPDDFSIQIFGEDKNAARLDKKLTESRLIVDDFFGKNAAIEERDGVAIARESGTAVDKAKYNLEAWAAGTVFPLHLELSIYNTDDEEQEKKIKSALHAALFGLRNELGCITFGLRKKRGLGRVDVDDWKGREYDMATREGMRQWQISQYDATQDKSAEEKGLEKLLGDALTTDKRKYFDVIAQFCPIDSLLVKTTDGAPNAPDHEHIQAQQADGKKKPVLPGTGVAGVLSTRIETISRTLRPLAEDSLIKAIFGTMDQTQKMASRLEVQEHVVENVTTDLIQQRTSLDYFTGGARSGALFSAQPVWGKQESNVQMAWRLRNPQDYEIGLLLHALKDIWTEDVAFGSEGSIGRGRFSGLCAIITVRQDDGKRQWTLIADKDQLIVQKTSETQSQKDPMAELEEYATAFWDWTQQKPENEADRMEREVSETA